MLRDGAVDAYYHCCPGWWSYGDPALTNLAFFKHWMTSGGSEDETEGLTNDAEAS